MFFAIEKYDAVLTHKGEDWVRDEFEKTKSKVIGALRFTEQYGAMTDKQWNAEKAKLESNFETKEKIKRIIMIK